MPDIDARILDLVTRAERGDAMTEHEVTSALAGVGEALAHSRGDCSATPYADVVASRMEAHSAVVGLLHRPRVADRKNEEVGRHSGDQ